MNFDKNIKIYNEYLNNIAVNIKNYMEDIKTFSEIGILEFVNNQILDALNLMKEENYELVGNKIYNVLVFCQSYNTVRGIFDDIFYKNLTSEYQNLSKEMRKFGELNDVLKNYKTYEIYKRTQVKYRFAYFIYLFLAIVVVCCGLRWSIDLMRSKHQWIEIYKITEYDFWVIKITTIFIVVTGITFCLKQAIHHQKKKDEAKRMYLELEALPTYMFNFSDKQKNEVYKELTGRYFGRDSDNAVYQDMSNTVQEQIRLSHEVLKSALEKI